MLSRMASRSWLLACLAAAGVAGAGGTSKRTAITVWGSAPAATGGAGYGGFAAPSGAMIVEHREVEVPASGELKIAGVAATLDPVSVQLRGEPSLQVAQQRFIPGATTPTEMLARHVGEPVSVVTPKGEVTGVLRSVDDTSLVIEIGSGDQRRISVMRRDGYVQDVRFTSGGADKPTLVWRLANAKPGKHQVELSYRADGIAWTADYLAVLDDTSKAIDFSAWANVKNASGATFDDAELTLIGGTRQAPARFAIARPVRLGTGETVQIELIPPRLAAKAHTVIVFEAAQEHTDAPSAPATECNQTGATAGRTEVDVEVDVPATLALPDGRVRAFRRAGGRLEVINEDPLRAIPGIARIRLSPDTQIVGERHQVVGTCSLDERARTIREKIEIKLENKGKLAVDVVVREALWRWTTWRIEDDGKSARVGPQTQELRVRIPAGGKQAVSYTAVYTW
jgi:hypothetical protein